MSATRSYHLTTRRYGNILQIWAVFLDGSRREIAVFELPENGVNFRADVEFLDNVLDAYKKRYAKIY